MNFEPLESPPTKIVRVERYQNEMGVQVHTHEDIATGELRYVGQGTIPIIQVASNGQQMQTNYPIEFLIVAHDIAHAFETFAEAAEIAGKAFKEQFDAQQRKAALMQGLGGMAKGMPKNVSRMPGR